MTELVSLGPLPTQSELTSAAYVANQVAGTDFVPDALRDKPASVLAAILAGRELGVGPMQALQKIHIIKGKPSPSPELMAGLVLRAGHVLHVVETSNERCTVEGMRRDGQGPTRITWTMDDAKQAGLTGDSWKKYPRAMLRSRAVAELCRAVFPDVLAGFSYVPEELGADVDEDGHPIFKEQTENLNSAPENVSGVEQAALPPVGRATGEVIDVPPPDLQKARLEAQAALSKLELMPDEIRHGLQAVYGVDDVSKLDAGKAKQLAGALSVEAKQQSFMAKALDAKAAAASWDEGKEPAK